MCDLTCVCIYVDVQCCDMSSFIGLEIVRIIHDGGDDDDADDGEKR